MIRKIFGSQGKYGELSRFAIVGVINTLLTITTIFLLMALDVNIFISNGAGYAAGLVASFTLNRSWTFQSHDRLGLILVIRFLFSVLISYCMNLIVVYACIESGISPYVAQVIGMPVYTLFFFMLSKVFVFKQSNLVPNHDYNEHTPT